MDKNNMTIDELAETVNKLIGKVENSDKRYAEVTQRRIKDYTTKGVLMKPFKNGNRNYYTEEHLNQLLKLRDLQVNGGISEKTLLKAVSSSIEPENVERQGHDESQIDLQRQALDILNGFQNNPLEIAKDINQGRNIQGKNISSLLVGSASLANSSVNNINHISTRVLNDLGNQYRTGKWTQDDNLPNKDMTGVASAAIANHDDKVNEEIKNAWDNQHVVFEDNDRNRSAVVRNQLMSKVRKPATVIELEKGFMITIDDYYRVTDETKLRELFEEILKAYKKPTDGS